MEPGIERRMCKAGWLLQPSVNLSCINAGQVIDRLRRRLPSCALLPFICLLLPHPYPAAILAHGAQGLGGIKRSLPSGGLPAAVLQPPASGLPFRRAYMAAGVWCILTWSTLALTHSA